MPLSVVAVYGVVTLAGWLWLPLVYHLLPAATDRGAGMVKCLVLFLAGYMAWLLTFAGVPGHVSFWGAAGGVCLVGVAGWRCWRRGVLAWLRGTWRTLLFIELVGIVVYGGLLIFRGYTADITTIEKYTNMAIVNSIALAPQVPPANAWFGGRPLNYYYFGHWTLAMLSHISGLDSNDLVIVATPLLALLCAQCCATIVMTLVPGGRGAGWSLVSGALLLLCGSLNETMYGLAHWHEEWQRTFFQSGITPAIVDALAPYGNLFEFPAVSILWGDFHAHFLGIPLMLVLIALFTQRIVSPAAIAAPLWYAACAIFLGSSYMTNSWQYPTFLTFWLVLVWWRWLRWRGTSVLVPLAESLLLPIGSLLAVLPFVLTFESFAVVPPADSTLQPVPLLPGGLLVWSPVGTTLHGLLLSIGLPLVLAGLAALALVRGRGWRWLVTGLLLGVVSAFYRPAGLVLLPLIAVGLWLAWSGQRGVAAGGLLLLVGVLVLLGCEYVMLPDHSLSRSNTIFKFYIQVWVLLTLAGPLLLASVWSNPAGQTRQEKRDSKQAAMLIRRRVFAVALLVVVLGSGVVFPILRGRQWLRYHGDRWWGLHGMAQVEAYQPDEAAAIAWLRAQPGTGGVLETIENSSHGTDVRIRPARFSSLTGRPTPIGWMGHTAQWNNYTTSETNRELYRNSVALVHGFAQTSTITEVYALMVMGNLDYVAFGAFEAQSWGEAGQALLARHLPLLWHSGAVQIYGRPADFPATFLWLHPIDWSEMEVSTDGRDTRFHWMLGQRGKLSLFSQQRGLVRLQFEPVNSTESGHIELWQNHHLLLEMDVVPYQPQPHVLWLPVEPGVTTLEVHTTIAPLQAADRSVTLAIAPPQGVLVQSW